MRVFIISLQRFPRGDAGANYIQYLGLALIKEKCEVIVTGVRTLADNSEYKIEEYKGIMYANTHNHKRRAQNFNYDKDFIDWLDREYHFTNDDYFIFYYVNYLLFRYFVKKRKFKNTYFVRVEDLQPNQFKFGRVNPKYVIERMAIKFAQKNMKGTFPISQLMADQDKRYSNKVFRLPIMADTLEYPFSKPEPRNDKIYFVYPGLKVTGVEDDYLAFFGALARLSKQELNRVEVHITGVKKNQIEQLVDQNMLKQLDSVIHFHGYLNYSDLVNIYVKSDFLLLPRKINNTTKANFPSKIPEIMSFSVIPICTDVGDYTKLYLNDGNSIIMKGTGIEPCLEGIRKALSMTLSERLLMRKEARSLAKNAFDYRIWSSKIYRFLMED